MRLRRLLLWCTLWRDSLSSELLNCADETCASQWLQDAAGNGLSIASRDVEVCLSNGWWSPAQEAIQLAMKQGNDYRVLARQAAEQAKRQAENMLKLLDDSEPPQNVSPAFQWAQGEDQIYLQIKYAFRWNSPGAVEVENENIELTDCCLHYSADGKHSGVRKRYILDLDFFADIDPEETEWNAGSVGKITFTIGKKEPGAWERLLKPEKKPANMNTWWEMRALHDPEAKAEEAEEKRKKEEEIKERKERVKNSRPSPQPSTQESKSRPSQAKSPEGRGRAKPFRPVPLNIRAFRKSMREFWLRNPRLMAAVGVVGMIAMIAWFANPREYAFFLFGDVPPDEQQQRPRTAEGDKQPDGAPPEAPKDQLLKKDE